jgi:glucose/mannose transport system substrate-binding protein
LYQIPAKHNDLIFFNPIAKVLFMRILIASVCALAVLSANLNTALAGEVEVLHYWTSGGEAKSLEVLKKTMLDRGHEWKDFAVAGGGGETAMTVLKKRVLDGNPPSAAQIKGPDIQEWARLKVLADLNSVAEFENWDKLLPKVVADVMKYEGMYVAAPVNVHRVNWMWANSDVLKKAGVPKMPTTWDEFFVAADKIRAAGFLPLAHGGQNWQDFTVFETVVLGTGGSEFYKDALVNLKDTSLKSEEMRKALETFRKLKTYTDDKSSGREWNVTTAMVIKGQAGFQFMGDWAKGEFLAAGKSPGKDFFCAAAPGTASAYTFNIDSFAMFRLRNIERQKAQGYLSASIMGAKFQETFNLNKGSIPVRQGVSLAKFDECAKASVRDFESTAKSGQLVPSVAHRMGLESKKADAMQEIVTKFWNDTSMSIDQAMKLLTQINAKPAEPAKTSAKKKPKNS